MEKQWFWHEIYLFMLNSSKNLFQPSYFPKFSNCHTLGIKKSRQWAILKNLISRAWKKLGTCPAAQKFQLLPRMISRLVHGNEVEFRARHENLNFMQGMKSDDIESTVRKRGCISCPAWKYKFHTRFMPGMKSGDIAATARKRGFISCPAWNRWKPKFHTGHENIFLADFKPGRVWI